MLATRTWESATVPSGTLGAAQPTACYKGAGGTFDPTWKYAAASTPETANAVHVGYIDDAGSFTDASAVSSPADSFGSTPVRDQDPSFDLADGDQFRWTRILERRITGADYKLGKLTLSTGKFAFSEQYNDGLANFRYRREEFVVRGGQYRSGSSTYATTQCPAELVAARQCAENEVWIGNGRDPAKGYDSGLITGASVVGWLSGDRLLLDATCTALTTCQINGLLAAELGPEGKMSVKSLLPPNARENTSPVISPDAHTVAFVSSAVSKEGFDIYTADADKPGSEPVKVGPIAGDLPALDDVPVLIAWQ